MKWWISDYDGTISHNYEGIWETEDHDFIKEWRKDNKFIVASGRVIGELMEIFNKYDVIPSYYICNNGAYVYDNNGNCLQKKNISLKVRKQLFFNLEKVKDKFSIGYCLAEKRRWYSKGFNPENRIKDQLHLQAEEELLNDENVNVICLIAKEEDALFAKSMINGIKGLKAVATSPYSIEIFDEKVSKAWGIEYIQKIEKFKWKDCITTGDGENDLEMLLKAKHSFAIDLASHVVQKAAKKKIKRVREFSHYIK